ncbi:MAG: PQQ-dependent sugar dehydrogenase [Planctomycetaceae bacterium]|nr:PQQ-dependent sugar dehydrogenase [Planctomycetaceae bacterium]
MNTFLVCLAVLCLQAPAAPAPTGSDTAKADIPRLQVQRLFPNIKLRRPVQAVQAPGDDKHLYVLEQAGRVMRLDLTKPDATEAEVWMDIREQVNSAGNELGLLSIVFDPKFADTHQFFLYYTADKPLRSELTRFNVAPATGMPVLKSAKVFLEVKQPYSNHNGGTVLFGPDGMLYLSLGDGGAANDPHGNSQNMGALLGKIIRIDVRRSEGGEPYAIPADNPFVDNPKAAPEIWATGLRNVWRMSFDRKTGQLYAGDVGQNAYEEVDLIVKGGNYGWNPREGLHAFDKGRPGTAGAAYIDPIAEYPHDQGVSVTGGHVYRGSKWPSLQGVYLYADYAFGTIWGLRCNGDRCTPSEVVWQRQGGKSMWSSFGELNNGELVLCAFDGTESGPGSLWMIQAAE